VQAVAVKGSRGPLKKFKCQGKFKLIFNQLQRE